MRTAVFKNKGIIEFIEKNDGHLSSENNEVIIRVKACGICGTDQHIYHGYPGSASVVPPRILGHELAGEVVAIGSKVSSLSVGDRVSVDPNIYCGECEFCRNGKVHLCNDLQAVGVTRDGGMGEYCAVPAANCYVIPNEMSFEEAAMIEPLGCVLHGFNKINIDPNHKVLIIGGGFIGQLFLQLVRNNGASKIIISEPSKNKHDLLYQLGADEVINPLTDLLQKNLGDGADIVIECVGRKESMEDAVKLARKGGQILLFGVSSPETSISVSPFEIFSKELSITGSFINPYTHPKAISLISQKKVIISPLISHRFTINEIPNVMETYQALNVSKGIIVY